MLNQHYGAVKKKTRKEGIRQGDPLSAHLFNLLLEKVMRESGLNRSGTIYNKSHRCIAYADDLTLLERTWKEMQRIVRNLEREARKVGLIINKAKTKYMRVGVGNEPGKISNSVTFKLEKGRQLTFDKVRAFTYLGTVLTDKCEEKQEISARLIKGQRCMAGLRHIMKSKDVTRTTKIRIYKTIIRPTVTYECETWVMNTREKNSLEVWERKVLRGFFGGKKVDGTWEPVLPI